MKKVCALVLRAIPLYRQAAFALIAGTPWCVSAAAQSTVWVDSDVVQSGIGTEAEPFKRITEALLAAHEPNSGITTIKVRSGTYDKANNESFPFNLAIDGLQFLGVLDDEEDPDTLPRIGGDVVDGDVPALIEVVAADGHVTGVVIDHFRFVGEDSAELDAPSAVYVANTNEYRAEVTLNRCSIERSEMHTSGADGRASIVGVGGITLDDGIPNGETEPGLDLTVVACTITPTPRGGIEIDVGSDAEPPAFAVMSVVVRDSTFVLSGSQAAGFAVDILLDAFTGPNEDPLLAHAAFQLKGLTIDSTACTSGGFTKGIIVGGVGKNGGKVSMPHSSTFVESNTVRGCSGDAITFVADEDAEEGTDVNVQCWDARYNVCIDNGGSGLVLDWGTGSGEQYLNVRASDSLFAANGAHGIWVRGADGGKQGFGHVFSSTIAENAGYGLRVEPGTQPYLFSGFANSIVWGNTYGSVSGWTLGVDDDLFVHNNWQGLFSQPSCTPDGSGNVSAHPGFAGTGDYHLDASSCLINKGTNAPPIQGLPADLDWDGARRILNGTIDIGVDEKG